MEIEYLAVFLIGFLGGFGHCIGHVWISPLNGAALPF